MGLAALGTSMALALSGGYLTVPWEGAVVKDGVYHTYRDSVGVPTTCFGETNKDHRGQPIKMGNTYTEAECLEMLTNTLISFEKQMDSYVKVPYKSDFMKASLLDFTYNVGVGAFSKSTLLRKLNAKDYDGACDELLRWKYAGGQVLKGLERRRTEERQWCIGEVPYEARLTYFEIAEGIAKRRVEESKAKAQ